jgi:DHA1 family tetracycline resistance protein-like MFS transporter
VLLLSLFGLGLDYVILSLAPDLWWLAAARFVGGGLSASFATANAFVADVSPPEKRAQNFGIVGAAIGVGFVLGPLIGGLLGEFGPRVPFVAAAIICAVDFAFAWFFLPESLAPENRRPFRLAEANPVGAFLAIRRYPSVIWLAVGFLAANVGERMLESVWVLYAGYRYAWGPAAVGISFAFWGILYAAAQAGLVRHAVKTLGEVRMLFVGLGGGAICMFLIGLASAGWAVYPVLAAYVLAWSLAGPAFQALVSRVVAPSEQGLLQGALASLATLTGVVAAPLGAGLFGYFVGPTAPVTVPGISFFLGGALFLVSLLMTRRVTADASFAPAAR